MANLRRFRGGLSGLQEAARGFQSETRERFPGLLKRVATPKLVAKHVDGATRVGQVLSLIFLGPVIVVSLALIVAINGVMSGIFGVSDYGESQTGIVGWLITGITGGAFLLAAYAWFQFVRTAGFGWFNFDD